MIRTNGQNDVIAAIHPAGGTWRVVIASTGGRHPQLLDAREVAESGVSDVLAKHEVTRVIGVLPASSVVCRTCTLPDAETEQLEMALRLQAEVHVHANTPEHRLAMAVLPGAPGETNRSGLVFAWPESASSVALPVPSKDATFAPDIAGLVALMDGIRPADPLLWLDRAHGTIALGVTHAGGAMFRGTRETADTADEWRSAVNRVLAESVLSVGHTGAFAESLVRAQANAIASVGAGGAKLILPPEVVATAARSFDGTPSDASWWQTFGIAAGVVLAAASELAAMTTLRESIDEARPSRLVAIGTALARPRTAFVTAVACLVIAGILPVAMAGLRVGVLKMKYPDLDAQTKKIRETQTQLAMYRALEGHAWSMTKVLSDIVSCTPEGIELEVVRLQQSDGSFAISGEARPHEGAGATDVIMKMQENLRDTRLFGEVRPTWGDKNAYGHYQFDLSAKVLRPHHTYDYPIDLDYARWPLAYRQADMPPPEESDDLAETTMAVDGTDGDGPGVTPDRTADRTADANTRLATATPVRTPVIDTPRPGRTTGQPASGSPAAGPTPGPTSGTPSPDSDPARVRRPSRVGTGVGGGVADGADRISDGDVRGSSGGPPAGLVEPLTKEQIAQLSIEEVNDRLPKVATARGRARRAGDMELATRLKEEFDLLMERKRSGR